MHRTTQTEQLWLFKNAFKISAMENEVAKLPCLLISLFLSPRFVSNSLKDYLYALQAALGITLYAVV